MHLLKWFFLISLFTPLFMGCGNTKTPEERGTNPINETLRSELLLLNGLPRSACIERLIELMVDQNDPKFAETLDRYFRLEITTHCSLTQ